MIKELFELSEETLNDLRPTCQMYWHFTFAGRVVGYSTCDNQAKFYAKLHVHSGGGCRDAFKYMCEKCVAQYQTLDHECYNCNESYVLHSKIGI